MSSRVSVTGVWGLSLSAERPVAVDWAVAREKYQAAQAEGVADGEWPMCMNWDGQFQGLVGGRICSALQGFISFHCKKTFHGVFAAKFWSGWLHVLPRSDLT